MINKLEEISAQEQVITNKLKLAINELNLAIDTLSNLTIDVASQNERIEELIREINQAGKSIEVKGKTVLI